MTRIIYLNLKTTGFESDADIIQIAVSKWRSDSARTWYIKPQKTISDNVAQDTGFSTDNGKLFFKGVEKKTHSLKDALQQFVNFLKSCNEEIVLVAHNAYFHARLLIRDLLKFKLFKKFHSKDVVRRFCDSLKLMRVSFPSKSKFNLPALAKDFLNLDLDSQRTADQDVIYLSRIIRRAGIPAGVILDNTHKTNFSVEKIECRWSLINSPLNGVLSQSMINKMADSSIHWDILVEMYDLGRDYAVEDFMTMIEDYDDEIIRDVNRVLRDNFYTNRCGEEYYFIY